MLEHPEQFTPDVLACVLAARAAHPGHAEVTHWLLVFCANVSRFDTELAVRLGRHADGVPLMLEARRCRLKGLLDASCAQGPGAHPVDIMLAVARARLQKCY